MSSFDPPKFFGRLARPAPPPASVPARPKLSRSDTAPVTRQEHDAYAAKDLAPLAKPVAHAPAQAGLRAPAGHTPGQPGKQAYVEHDDAHSIAESHASYVTAASGPTPASSVRSPSLHSSDAQSIYSDAPRDARAIESDYRTALELLHKRTSFARKAMPRVMQSAGFGLALAGAIHNPLLLFVAPLLLVSGAILAAPAGWVIAKVLQQRAQKNQGVISALTWLKHLDEEEGGLAARAKVTANPKLAYAEAFANGGGKPFETGFRNAFVGPFKFWRKQFNETIDAVSTTMQQRRANVSKAQRREETEAKWPEEKNDSFV